MYTAITGAVVTGGVAAVEAVAGRVSRLMEVGARVGWTQGYAGAHANGAGDDRAQPDRVGREPALLESTGWGLAVRSFIWYRLSMSGRFWAACDPEEWIVDATLTGAQTVYRAQRAARRVAARHP